MIFMFRYVVDIDGMTVMANTCLAVIVEANTDSGWSVHHITLVADDPSVTFLERAMADVPSGHWLWGRIAADILGKHKAEVSAKWMARRRTVAHSVEIVNANS